ncbi:hypothetical protein [Roseibium sp.]|uniref:hypothetical protein n=1 Tax=Roseibium sp. TaxID=1936156 RepID=UPI003B524B3B
MKQKICIEKLLKWAYCEELPKAGFEPGGAVRSGWASIETFAQLLTKIDDNEYGVVPSLNVNDGDPHEDALRVHAAVCGLSDRVVDFPDGWNPMPEIGIHEKHCAMALSAARFGIKNANRQPFDLIRRHAILGGCPGWEGEVPELKTAKTRKGTDAWFRMRVDHSTDAFGRPVERKFETEDGWCYVRKAPKIGAYRKFFFDPDPVSVLIGRGEYQMWWSHLVKLAENLSGQLEKWDVQPSPRVAIPWETGAPEPARILLAVSKNS